MPYGAIAASVLGAIAQGRTNRINSQNIGVANATNRDIARETNQANLQNAVMANNANSLTAQVRQFRALGGSLQGALGNSQQQAAVAPTAETGAPQQAASISAPDFSAIANVSQLVEQKRVNDSIINVNNANALEKNYSNEDKQSAQAAWAKINEAYVSGDLDIEDLRSASYAAKLAGVDLSGLRPSAVAALEDIAQQAYNGYKADVGYENTQADTKLKESQTKLADAQKALADVSKEKLDEELKQYPAALALARQLQREQIANVHEDTLKKTAETFGQKIDNGIRQAGFEAEVAIKQAEMYIKYAEQQYGENLYYAEHNGGATKYVAQIVDTFRQFMEMSPLKFGK